MTEYAALEREFALARGASEVFADFTARNKELWKKLDSALGTYCQKTLYGEAVDCAELVRSSSAVGGET